MNRGPLFSELKRRNVYKVAIAYAVVAWLLIQAASIFFPDIRCAAQQHDAGLPGLRTDTLLPNLHDDPRWNAFLRKTGLADDQLK